MSWHKITLPIPPTKDIDPKVVEIGDLAKARWEKENRPEGVWDVSCESRS